ncbi:MAG: hypothetical protein FWF85_00220 [Clostridiales bacterium]|nr:hypothetical protein [Clostridiales bacterium]MDR2713816.1 hypothetical protein [Clostridiales bacterium]
MTNRGYHDIPILETPPRPNEHIVSVRWATPENIPNWEETLTPYFNR